MDKALAYEASDSGFEPQYRLFFFFAFLFAMVSPLLSCALLLLPSTDRGVIIHYRQVVLPAGLRRW